MKKFVDLCKYLNQFHYWRTLKRKEKNAFMTTFLSCDFKINEPLF